MIKLHNASLLLQGPARAGERGLALLVVLWIVVAAALVVTAFNATVKSGVSFVGSEVQLARRQALLDAGAEIAAAHLIDEEESRWWLPDGTPHTIMFAGSNLAITIADGNARIDLNKADKELLMGLLRQFAGSQAQAAGLRDRILLARRSAPGTPETGRTQPGQRAHAAAAEHTANKAPAFVDVAQLRSLKGMSLHLYQAIAPFLTVYSSDGRINPLAAPDAVLMSIPEVARGDIEKLRAAVRAPPSERNEAPPAVALRAESFLTDKPGPAYVVTVQVLRHDGSAGASSVYVLALGLDKQAPYRLITKRPAASGRPGGTG